MLEKEHSGENPVYLLSQHYNIINKLKQTIACIWLFGTECYLFMYLLKIIFQN